MSEGRGKGIEGRNSAINITICIFWCVGKLMEPKIKSGLVQKASNGDTEVEEKAEAAHCLTVTVIFGTRTDDDDTAYNNSTCGFFMKKFLL